MKNLLLKICIGIGILAQFAVLIGMISSNEKVLRKGELVRFRVRPVDPYDLVKGKYAYLNLSNLDISHKPSKVHYDRYTPIFVHLKKDAEGFAVFDKIILQKDQTQIPNDQTFFKSKVIRCSPHHQWVTNFTPAVNGKITTNRYWKADGTYTVRFDIPFQHYYLNEKLAPLADLLLSFGHSGTNRLPVVALVRMLDGKTALEGVEVGGEPLREYLLKELEKQKKVEDKERKPDIKLKENGKVHHS